MSEPSANEIPATMKRLVVTANGADVASCKIEVEIVPVPVPASGELLIKVSAAAINPSDYMSWSRTKTEHCPATMGNEGSGVVVATGGGLVTHFYSVGTAVGFAGLKNRQGAYSEYVTASAIEAVFRLPADLPVQDAASFFVNPYTAVGILDTARREGAAVIVHTAAASQLGQMMVKLAPSVGIDIINVVRRQEQAELLKKIGATHVVVTGNDDAWKKVLQAKVNELGATVAFDAVAGQMSGDLLDLMPKNATVFVYGGLSGLVQGINPLDLIYNEKKFKGFFLSSWIKSGGMLKSLYRLNGAGSKVNSGLQAGGWSSSQFKDTTLEDAHDDIVKLLNSSITGVKLRIRF